jgi:hypothetical protein
MIFIHHLFFVYLLCHNHYFYHGFHAHNYAKTHLKINISISFTSLFYKKISIFIINCFHELKLLKRISNYCNFRFEFIFKVRVYKGASQEWSFRSHISCSRECRKVWGNELTLSSELSFWVLESNGFPNFQRVIVAVKTHWIEDFLIPLKNSWNVDD